jgi:hypothetical protein
MFSPYSRVPVWWGIKVMMGVVGEGIVTDVYKTFIGFGKIINSLI